MQKGHQAVEQGGQVLGCGPGEGCLFSASDPYVLRNVEPYRALYIEIPRAAMAKRIPVARLSQAVHLNTAYGMGRIVSSLCGAMVLESGTVVGSAREVLSE